MKNLIFVQCRKGVWFYPLPPPLCVRHYTVTFPQTGCHVTWGLGAVTESIVYELQGVLGQLVCTVLMMTMIGRYTAVQLEVK